MQASGLTSETQVLEFKWNKVTSELRHFRKFSEICSKDKGSFSIDGAAGRLISGSGQFSAGHLLLISNKIQGAASGALGRMTIIKPIIVDLRKEPHGFINDLPVTCISNKSEEFSEIDKEERQQFNAILSRTIPNKRGKPIEVLSSNTERSLVEKNELQYVRIPVKDHCRPSDASVDDFLSLIKNNPKSWLHVHCHVGKGRTTTFLAIYDMFYNAKKVSFDDILARQLAIDGADLKETSGAHSKRATKRLIFLRKFYKYCRNADLESISWSEWCQKKSNG